MRRYYSLYVPGTDGLTQTPDPSQQALEVKCALRAFATWFGGATAVNGQGSYMSKTGDCVIEPVVIVTAYCDDVTSETHEDDVRLLAGDLCRRMNQECVALLRDGDMSLIEPAYQKAA